MAKPAAYCPECRISSTPERHDSGPQVIHHLASCSEHPDNRPEPDDEPDHCPRCMRPAVAGAIVHRSSCPERPEPQLPAAELQPGQRVLIYGSAAALVDRVEPDPHEHDTPFVVLHYTTGPDANGSPIPGRWGLPAAQLVPLLP